MQSVSVFFIWCLLFYFPAHTKPVAVFVVPVEFQKCILDSDCVEVGNDCAGCCQSKAINFNFKIKFEKQMSDFCKSYKGPVCDCCAPDFHAKCRQSKCELIEVAGSSKKKCGQ